MALSIKLNKNKSTDRKGLQTHFKGLDTASSGVFVGIQDNAHDYPDGTDVKLVAMINEYGSASVGIPPRHFLSRAVAKDKKFYEKQIQHILKNYKKGEPNFINASFREMGRTAVEKVQYNVFNNTIGMTPNKPAVAKRKGGNQPAVDTKHLIEQVDYELIGSAL